MNRFEEGQKVWSVYVAMSAMSSSGEPLWNIDEGTVAGHIGSPEQVLLESRWGHFSSHDPATLYATREDAERFVVSAFRKHATKILDRANAMEDAIESREREMAEEAFSTAGSSER